MDNNLRNINFNIKVLFLGDRQVGKSSLINTYLGNEFDPYIYSSYTYDYFVKKITKENVNYTFKIFDFPGSERFRNMIRPNLRQAKIIVLVFDMTDKKTFLELDYILEIVHENLGNNKFNFILVGNKADLIDQRKVKEEDCKKFAEILGAKFFLSSAKSQFYEFREFLTGYFEEFIEANKDELINNRNNNNQQRILLNDNRRRRRNNNTC